MSLSTALWIAGAVALLVTVFIGEKIIDLDFSGLQPQNRKKAKRARLLAARATRSAEKPTANSLPKRSAPPAAPISSRMKTPAAPTAATACR